MAKSNLSWSLVDSKLTVEVLALEQKITFDLVELFPTFMDFEPIQQKVIANGVKQKLADHVARTTDVKLTPAEMVTELKAMWVRLTVDKMWNSGKGGGGGFKKAELQAQLAEKQEQLDEKDRKLAEQAELIAKLTANAK
jgi:hypothetical protein